MRGNIAKDDSVFLSEELVANGHQATSYMAEILGIDDGREIRPCIAIHFKDGCIKGDKTPGRDVAAHLIAVELQRLAINESQATIILEKWDDNNRPPLGYSIIQRKISGAFRRKNPYHYGCNHFNLGFTCIGQSTCHWFNKNGLYKENQSIIAAFSARGWIWILSDPAKLIYLVGLPKLEGRRSVAVGGTIFAGYRELAAMLGWKTHSRIKRYLDELKNFGLIQFEPGSKLCKDKKASSFSRVIEIPPVPEIYHKLIGGGHASSDF
jgi:hypothetical protein